MSTPKITRLHPQKERKDHPRDLVRRAFLHSRVLFLAMEGLRAIDYNAEPEDLDAIHRAASELDDILDDLVKGGAR